jgi:hypothetical protein
MENTLPQAGAIRMLGTAVGPVSANLKLPMIATCDIGAAAAGGPRLSRKTNFRVLPLTEPKQPQLRLRGTI